MEHDTATSTGSRETEVRARVFVCWCFSLLLELDRVIMALISFGSPTVIESVSSVHSGHFIRLLSLSLSLSPSLPSLSLSHNIRGCGKHIF